MDDLKVRVLLEDINHKFEAIFEVVKDNPQRFDKLEKEMEIIKEDIAIIKSSIPLKANASDLDKIKKDVANLQKRFAS